MYIKCPAELPPLKEFYIFGAPDENNKYLCEIIKCCKRGSVFAGFVSNVEVADGFPVVCCEPNALLLQNSQKEPFHHDWYTMPVPVGDGWSYWEIGKLLLPLLQVDNIRANGLLLESGALKKFLSAYRPGSFNLSETNLFVINPNVYLSTSTSYKGNKELIKYILNSLSNWRSRQIFYNVLTGNPLDIMNMFFSTFFAKVQYMNYLSLHPGDIIINVGIHVGSEIPFFLSGIRGTGKIYCIDPLGFKYLSAYAKAYCEIYHESIELLEIAFASYDGVIKLPVSANQVCAADSVGVSQLEHVEFPCIKPSSLIDRLQLSKVDVLKIDIEGGERDILDEVIIVAKKYRPQIAISIYHDRLDYIKIPAKLMISLADYDFYVEHYSFERFETVLYCIPFERGTGERNMVLEMYSETTAEKIG